MKFLNLGCGSNRPIDSTWINIDNLRSILHTGTPERRNLDAEPNYIDMDISQGLKFPDSSIDGVLASHVLEHFDLQESIKLVMEIKRVLKVGGVLRVLSPCPQLLYSKVIGGCEDFGEYCPEELDFMSYALFFFEHKQILGLQELFCLFYYVGFEKYFPQVYKQSVLDGLANLDNREKFSVIVEAIKDYEE